MFDRLFLWYVQILSVCSWAFQGLHVFSHHSCSAMWSELKGSRSCSVQLLCTAGRQLWKSNCPSAWGLEVPCRIHSLTMLPSAPQAQAFKTTQIFRSVSVLWLNLESKSLLCNTVFFPIMALGGIRVRREAPVEPTALQQSLRGSCASCEGLEPECSHTDRK